MVAVTRDSESSHTERSPAWQPATCRVLPLGTLARMVAQRIIARSQPCNGAHSRKAAASVAVLPQGPRGFNNALKHNCSEARPGLVQHCAQDRRQSSAAARVACSASPPGAAVQLAAPEAQEQEVWPGVVQGFWTWRGYRIRYQRSANTEEAADAPRVRGDRTPLLPVST